MIEGKFDFRNRTYYYQKYTKLGKLLVITEHLLICISVSDRDPGIMKGWDPV